MVEFKRDKQRRFGWYRPKPDGVLDINIAARPLDDETWAEFCQLTKVASDFRAFMIDYMALRFDFEALSSASARLASNISYVIDARMVSALEGIEAQAEAQRLVTNFLGAASAFRDRATTRLVHRFGKSSKEATAFNAKKSGIYDRSFAYRTLYALRNHAQHHENPLSMVPIKADRDPDGKLGVKIALQLDPLSLAANPKTNAKLRAELQARGGELLNLLTLVSENMSEHDELMLCLIEIHGPRIVEMAHYAAALHGLLEIPADAVPVVWEGSDPAGGPQTQDRWFECGFDELEKIIRLGASLRGETIPSGN